jgi:hypothetical protein
MNKLKLLAYEPGMILYQYTPENKGEPGEIVFDVLTGKVEVRKRAQNDESGSYAHKASNRVAEYAAKKNLPLDAIQAWY